MLLITFQRGKQSVNSALTSNLKRETSWTHKVRSRYIARLQSGSLGEHDQFQRFQGKAMKYSSIDETFVLCGQTV